MAGETLVVSRVGDVVVADLRNASILDSGVVDGIGNQLYAIIDQQAQRKLVVDFSHVKFLSSQMIGVLLSLHKKSIQIGGKVIFCGLKPELMKVFKIMRLEKLLNFAANEEEAVAQFDVYTR